MSVKTQLKTVRTVSRSETCSTRPLIVDIWVWLQAAFPWHNSPQ